MHLPPDIRQDENAATKMKNLSTNIDKKIFLQRKIV